MPAFNVGLFIRVINKDYQKEILYAKYYNKPAHLQQSFNISLAGLPNDILTIKISVNLKVQVVHKKISLIYFV